MKKARKSAGILLFRYTGDQLEVFLVHPGGPYWARRDAGVWSIPKGEFSDDENPLVCARREFFEETGHQVDGAFLPLSPRRQKSGKMIYAWALMGNVNEKKIVSNNFEMEWPPSSGKSALFPEVDKADWFPAKVAREKIIDGQAGFIDELEGLISKE